MSKNAKIIVISVVAVLLIAGGLFIFFYGRKPAISQEAKIEFWGVFDDSDVFRTLIEEYNEIFPKVEITYYKKDYQTYEKDLLETMAAGQGPDIFMLHHTWLPRYQGKIIPVSSSEVISLKQVQEEFVDVAANDFIKESKIYALPLTVDTIALYYNKNIFNSAGLPQPPQNWEEFLTDVEKLTARDEGGNIVRAGAAVGGARNVNRSTDVVALLMLQSGARMSDENTGEVFFHRPVVLEGETFYPGERALQFYTDFANPLKSIYTWNNRMDYSIDIFSEGKAAMMLNYSYHIPTIKAKSPYLNFALAPMPQIKGSANSVNYANYWGLTVSRNSKDSQPAWQFIRWLSQKEQAKKYLELSKRPTARRDLVNWQKDDLDLAVFAQQSLSAYSWRQVDNLTIEQELADMIESVVLGEATTNEAINKAANNINLGGQP